MAYAGQKELRRLLPVAILTTAAVILLPATVVLAALALVDPDPNPLVISAVGVAIALGVTTTGYALWARMPLSSDVSFGELMIWGWFRRKRAEDRLVVGTQLLGLNRTGQVERGSRISTRQQINVLRDLNAALESKDPYTHGHSRRVERHAYRIALTMGLSIAQIEELRIAAALHDVGKLRVSDRVLRKPGALTDEERTIIEEHVAVGAWMVSKIGSVDTILGVRHHHEHWDGRGYLDGLSGPDIPLFARIIAVADAYDAITSTRPYRARAGRERAIAVIRYESGKQFDPDVVEAFLSTLPAVSPVPLSLTFVFLGAVRRLLRETAVFAKRVSAGSIAPAVTAAGTAVVMSVAAMSPTIASPPSSAPQIVVRTASGAKPVGGDVPMSSVAKSDLSAPRNGAIVLGQRIEKRKASAGSPGRGAQTPTPSPDTDPSKARPNPQRKSNPHRRRGPGPKSVPKPAMPEPADDKRCHKHTKDKDKDSPGHVKHCG